MTGNQCKGGGINLQEIFGANKDGLKELLRELLQEVLEQEMTGTLGAEKDIELVSALAEMYIQVRSTRKVKAITEPMKGLLFGWTAPTDWLHWAFKEF